MRLRYVLLCGVAAAILAVAGCGGVQDHEEEVAVAPEVMQQYLADKPAHLHPYYRRVLTQGKRNFVLNHMRAGLAALDSGALETAARSFDQALLNIETIYADNAEAEKARSKFIKENIKDFKGENYERFMAYYYRGLIYLMEGDYDNARASFKGGMLQDAFAEDTKYGQDVAMLAYLEGWATQCRGERLDALALFDEAKKLREKQLGGAQAPSGIHSAWVPVPPADHNLLLVGESGGPPVKRAVGRYKEKLVFGRSRASSVDRFLFLLDDGPRSVPMFEDIVWQAVTRGGRPVDYIMEGKAHFKSTTGSIGDAALIGGAAVLNAGAQNDNSGAAVAGMAAMGLGLIFKGISSATRPEADARFWDNLPEHVHLATTRYSGDASEIAVRLQSRDGAVIGATPHNARLHVNGNCGIAWVRSRPAAPNSY